MGLNRHGPSGKKRRCRLGRLLGQNKDSEERYGGDLVRRNRGNTHPSAGSRIARVLGFTGLLLLGAASAAAQGPPPSYSPDDLDRLVSRIALYPDSLLAQTLAAASFPDQIPDAA